MFLFTSLINKRNKSSNSNKITSTILQLSQDILTDVIIPYFNSNMFIAFAGVCSEWRRIAKQFRGFKYVNVKHNSSEFQVCSLTDNEMSGLTKGDLSELFSEFEIIKFPIKGIDDGYNMHSRSVFQKLFNSKKIEKLTLCNTNLITIVIPAKNLSPITSLTLIDVSMNIENLRTICNSLQNLKDLTLIDNKLNYEATLVITKSNLNQLEKLTLCNPIGNDGVNHIITQPGNIRTLKKLEFLSNNRYSYSEPPSYISYVPPIDSSILPNLDSFTMEVELKNSPTSIMNVLRSGNLWKELTFKSTDLDDQCMKQIGNIHSLQKLCILYAVDLPEAFSYLLSLQTNLTHLEIGPVNNKTLSYLSVDQGKFLNLKYLFILSITGGKIEEFVMKKLCEKIPNVTHLELRRVEMKSGCMMNHVSQLVKVTDLRLIETNIDSEGMKCLSGMSNLTRLDLGSNTLDGISYLCNGNLLNLTTLKFTKTLHYKKYDLAFVSCLAADGSNIPKLRYLSFFNDFEGEAMQKLISGGDGLLLRNLIHLELIWVELAVFHLENIVKNLAPKFLTGYGSNYELKHDAPEVIPKLKPTIINFLNSCTLRRIDDFIDNL